MRALVGGGALEFEGRAVELPFTKGAFRYFCTTYLSNAAGGAKRGSRRSSSNRDVRTVTDVAPWQDEALREVSLGFMGARVGMEADGSLEYPNMLYAFGKSPGTTTLAWYVGMKGMLNTPLDFARTGEARKRKMKLITILERLNELTQRGLEEVSDCG
jgi:hypothetical protein